MEFIDLRVVNPSLSHFTSMLNLGDPNPTVIPVAHSLVGPLLVIAV